ncbi:MAG: 50S ribosomal protein L10 [Bacillales bacterium]|nr:50S ribosomal protein L10 [Bacillales bacterium]
MNQNVLEQKKAVVDEVSNILKESASVVIVEYRGLKVSEIMDLKRNLLKADSKMSVYKNTLVDRAADACGYSEIKQYLEGPNAVIYSKDSISAAKIATKFAKTHENLVIKAAIVDGRVVGKDDVIALSKLPGREGLLSMLLSVLQAPVRGFACAVKAVADKQ